MSEKTITMIVYAVALAALLLFAAFHVNLGLPVPEWLIGAISAVLGALVTARATNGAVNTFVSSRRSRP